jgi:formamidopyrimidine-DNA glycosylase
MPELPDIVAYLDALSERILHQTLLQVRIASPFLLRSVNPPLESVFNQAVVQLERIGKRVAIGLENQAWLVIHLMIAGRLQWQPKSSGPLKKGSLAAFDFSDHSLILTEAGSQHRASLMVVTTGQLADLDPGGIQPLSCTVTDFAQALQHENHTLKRCLTDPTVFSGIGNAYSDEILHRAQLSPILHSQKLSDAQVKTLYDATQSVLQEWIARFQSQRKGGFPLKVTAFRPEMAAHGKFGQPCPRCSSPIQRIRYANNETNYCPTCQTEGKVLADRSLSRLLGKDWPRTLEELEALKRR